MFAVACTDFTAFPDAKVCSFKCSDETFAELCERDGVVPAPYLARAGWVALDDWGSLSDSEIATLVARSYGLVRAKLPRKVQATLDAATESATPARRANATVKTRKPRT